MNSIYHILDKVPAIYKEEMQDEYEQLALRLVQSGKLKIDTDYYCNFIRYSDPNLGINMFFSHKEVNNKDLIEKTKENIKKIYSKANRHISDQKISSLMLNLSRKASKLLIVSDELQMRLARVLVQSAHPIVIHWLLLDGVDVFITYSNSIGDVMDIASWKRAGNNSGMQSTDGQNVCVYVSCGGDPFAENIAAHPTYGDGWAALARLQIIAGQELGHFADIKRDRDGRQISRHSANFACTKATPHVKEARRNDIKRCKSLIKKLDACGMKPLGKIEADLKFYYQQKLSGARVLWLKLLAKYYRYKLLSSAQKNKLFFVKKFDRERFMATALQAMFEDMFTHLSPVADVYKRDDPEAEEAISCVEALARVPQQANKWGYLTTRATMRNLYKVYYNEVIPSLIENYQHLTKTKYKRNFHIPKQGMIKKILTKLGIIGPKDRFKFVEVREF